MFRGFRGSFIVLAVACAAVTYGAQCTTARLDPIGGGGDGGGGGTSSGSSGDPNDPNNPESKDGSTTGGDASPETEDGGGDGGANAWPCPPPGDGGTTTFDREWMTGPAPKAEPTAANYAIRTNTVCDKSTHLEWQRAVIPDLKTWNEAMAYCDSLLFEGASDWRLPTRIEMLTITDHSRKAPAIDPTAFPSTPTDTVFWSSTIMAGVFNSPNAFYVSFEYGYAVPYDKADKNHVRCVRGGR